MGLGSASLNLIVAGELIRLGSAFAIRLGASYYCALPPAFLHSDLNFFRALPCKPLALA
jgi:hypothetical protein